MKNIQLKFTAIMIAIGTAIISTNNIFYVTNFDHQNLNFINFIAGWVISVLLYILFSIVSVSYILKIVTKPFSNIVDNANLYDEENDDRIKYLEEAKNSGEDKFSRKINTMTEELKNNLKTANKQKNQVEAILLHIKDGIIAFDLDGNITYINPAAIELFELEKNDDPFEKLFNKVNIDVNLEKIVYLDDVTSFELKVYINEKYINVFLLLLKIQKIDQME